MAARGAREQDDREGMAECLGVRLMLRRDGNNRMPSRYRRLGEGLRR